MNKEINIGLIGYGMAGKYFHAPFIHFTVGLKLSKVLERHSDNSIKDYPYVKIVRSLEGILNDNEVDLVVITSPNPTHYDYARESLLAGKHVVLEKPITTTIKEANELIEISKKENKLLCPFQNRRWDGDFLTVKRLIEKNKFGKLVEFESHFDRFRNYLRPDTWKEEDLPGSGILYDLGSHLIDQALVLFGLPKSVTADIRKQREFSKTDDYFDVRLDYENLKVSLKAGTLVLEDSPRFILHGTRAAYVKYGLDPQEEALKQGHRPGEKNWGEEPENLWGNLITEKENKIFNERIKTFQGCYQNFYKNICEAILNNKELLVKPAEAKNIIRVIELAYQSNKINQTISFK